MSAEIATVLLEFGVDLGLTDQRMRKATALAMAGVSEEQVRAVAKHWWKQNPTDELKVARLLASAASKPAVILELVRDLTGFQRAQMARQGELPKEAAEGSERQLEEAKKAQDELWASDPVYRMRALACTVLSDRKSPAEVAATFGVPIDEVDAAVRAVTMLEPRVSKGLKLVKSDDEERAAQVVANATAFVSAGKGIPSHLVSAAVSLLMTQAGRKALMDLHPPRELTAAAERAGVGAQ